MEFDSGCIDRVSNWICFFLLFSFALIPYFCGNTFSNWPRCCPWIYTLRNDNFEDVCLIITPFGSQTDQLELLSSIGLIFISRETKIACEFCRFVRVAKVTWVMTNSVELIDIASEQFNYSPWAVKKITNLLSLLCNIKKL